MGVKKLNPITEMGKPQEVSVATQLNALNIPTALYAAIKVGNKSLEIAEISRGNYMQYSNEMYVKNVDESIYTFLKNAARQRNVKYIAVSLEGTKDLKQSISRLWLEDDIVPYIVENDKRDVTEIVKEVASRFNEENIVYVGVDENNEVEIAELVSLYDYERTATVDDMNLLKKLVREFRGKKMVFINATPQGGGVALMRHALIRLYRLLGVDARWFVLTPNPEVFNVTKFKFHNVLQAVSPKGVELTDADKRLFDKWSEENANKFQKVFKEADVIVIDDWQPSGLVPHIKKMNPKAKILFRSHIQIVAELADKEGTPQRKTWSFIWNKIKDVDVFISHPMKMFIPKDVPVNKIVYLPAATDPLDGLNKPLTETQMAYYMKQFNKLLILQEGQTAMDPHRPYIVQIARFDPSKGIPDVIEAYRNLCDMMKKSGKVIPQLVIAGNASIDDPDGIYIYKATIELLKSAKYKHIADDVKVARIPHMDQMLNTLLRKSKVVLQLSIKEGFEIKVTEGLMKAKPVITYRTGGIPLQIEEGVNGFLVEPGDCEQVAHHLYDLFTDDELYKKMSFEAERYANSDYLTVPNALCWLFLAEHFLRKGSIDGHYLWVKDLAYKYYGRKAKSKFLSRLFSPKILPGIFK